MQFLKQRIVLGLAAVGLSVTLAPEAIAHRHTQKNASSQIATRFEQTEVDSGQLIAVAAPIGRTNGYQLLVIEQLSDHQACWQEQGTNPTLVDPLLLNFDFSGICGRSTDSNGYSIRAGQQDLGLRYSLQVRERGGELVLVGVPVAGDRNLPRLEIGRTRGLPGANFTRIHLDPGWRFTHRSYEGQTLGHVYLTHDLTLAQLANQNPSRPSYPTQETLPTARPETPPQSGLTSQEADGSDRVETIEFGDDPRVTPSDNTSSDSFSAPQLPSLDSEAQSRDESVIDEEIDDQPFAAPVPRRQFPDSPLPAFRDES